MQSPPGGYWPERKFYQVFLEKADFNSIYLVKNVLNVKIMALFVDITSQKMKQHFSYIIEMSTVNS